MDNNIIKDNCIEIIPSKEIAINNKIQTVSLNKELLPIIVNPQQLALPILEKDFSKISKKRKIKRYILKFIQAIYKRLTKLGCIVAKVVSLMAKVINWSFLTSAKFVCLIAMSAIVIISTTILTKNIVNAQMRNARS